MSYNLENLKDRIESFSEELNSYNHDNILSWEDGIRLCDFLTEVILLSENNKKDVFFKVEIKYSNFEYLGLKKGEWYRAEKYINIDGEFIYKVYGDNKYGIEVDSNMIEELGEWD